MARKGAILVVLAVPLFLLLAVTVQISVLETTDAGSVGGGNTSASTRATNHFDQSRIDALRRRFEEKQRQKQKQPAQNGEAPLLSTAAPPGPSSAQGGTDGGYDSAVSSGLGVDLVARLDPTAFPHPLFGENINNAPSTCCNFAPPEAVLPPVFAASRPSEWFKVIGLSKSPPLVGPPEPAEPAAHGGDAPPVVTPEPGEPRHEYYQEIVKLATAFHTYDKDPASPTTIPVYAVTCIGGDCAYIGHQIDKVFPFGVGFFVWFVNGDHGHYLKMGRLFQQAFPKRFLLMNAKEQLGCSGTWNRILRLFYFQNPNPVPFIIFVNGDFYPRDFFFKEYLKYIRSRITENHNHTIVKFQHYSFYAYTYAAWRVLGYFDESVFPAYGEDVEMVYRARSLGITFDDYAAKPHMYFHAQSSSARDHRTAVMLNRWARDHYVKQKWNINMYSTHWENVDFAPLHKHPWGVASIPHRSSFSIDAEHVRCVRDGLGQRIPGSDQCFYNAKVVQRLMPTGEKVPPELVVLKRWNV